MFGWLGGWFARGWSGLDDLANAVRDAITNAINQLVGQFVAWVDAFWFLVTAFGYTGGGLLDFVGSMFSFGRRLIFIVIPAAAANALNSASRYAEWLVGQAVALVRQLVAVAVDTALRLAADVRQWAQGQITAILGYIQRISALLNTVAHLVLSLLTNPVALADFVAGSIVQAVYRWASGRAELLARWAFNGAVVGALRFVDVAERIIADLFL